MSTSFLQSLNKTMDFITVKVGSMDNNCYVLYDEQKNAVCIDPGEQSEKITACIRENGLCLKAIIVTHAHFDHILALDKVYHAFEGVTLYATDSQKAALCDSKLNLSSLACAKPYECSLPIEQMGDSLDVGSMSIKVLSTPGHTVDSVCYYTEGKLFSGDTLFAGTIGRTDFPGGDFEIMKNSLAMLKRLPLETKVCPGHGNSTEIGYETKCNPYMLQ